MKENKRIKINGRLLGSTAHVGGGVASDSLDPNRMTEEVIEERRKAREAQEDAEVFKTY